MAVIHVQQPRTPNTTFEYALAVVDGFEIIFAMEDFQQHKVE
jgi:hypothetical protein